MLLFVDLYIKQHKGLHTLSIRLFKHSACSVPSLTQFSLLSTETFDKFWFGSEPIWPCRGILSLRDLTAWLGLACWRGISNVAVLVAISAIGNLAAQQKALLLWINSKWVMLVFYHSQRWRFTPRPEAEKETFQRPWRRPTGQEKNFFYERLKMGNFFTSSSVPHSGNRHNRSYAACNKEEDEDEAQPFLSHRIEIIEDLSDFG